MVYEHLELSSKCCKGSMHLLFVAVYNVKLNLELPKKVLFVNCHNTFILHFGE